MKNNPELRRLIIRLSIFLVLMSFIWSFQLYLPREGELNYEIGSSEYHAMNDRLDTIIAYMENEGTLTPISGSVEGWNSNTSRYEDAELVITVEETNVNVFLYKRQLFTHLGYRIDLKIVNDD